jgi:predicted nucleic acid-binding Zn ribbon protein
VVGGVVAVEAQPVAERAGTLTVACRSSAWASELELLAPELLDKLNRALGGPGAGPLTKLRARVGNLP